MVENTAQRLGALGFVSKMMELTKISADRAHKFFKVLYKLDLLVKSQKYDDISGVYNAWKYSERNEHLLNEQDEDA